MAGDMEGNPHYAIAKDMSGAYGEKNAVLALAFEQRTANLMEFMRIVGEGTDASKVESLFKDIVGRMGL